MIGSLKMQFPHLYIVEIVDNSIHFNPENDRGNIEYKRTLTVCNENKKIQYATQMYWRMSQSLKHTAIYYIGVDDDGTIVGLTIQEMGLSIKNFIKIVEDIEASISGVHVIHCNDKYILKITVKKKNIVDTYLVDFE
jgi:GTPase